MNEIPNDIQARGGEAACVFGCISGCIIDNVATVLDTVAITGMLAINLE